jgi:hypothetical protein
MRRREKFAAALRGIWRYYWIELPERMNLWVRRMHAPVDVGEPGKPHPYCLRCRTDWPCPEEIRLAGEQENRVLP